MIAKVMILVGVLFALCAACVLLVIWTEEE
jgi:hypothetical protein